MNTNRNLYNERRLNSNYKQLVERIYAEPNKPMGYKGTIESKLYELFAKTSKLRYTWKRETFKRLLLHLYDQKCYRVLRVATNMEVLHKMSAFGDRIVRPIENWKVEDRRPNYQISSLIRHCYARYETPRFMEKAFYFDNKLHMLWYVQLGSGKSVKELSQLPIPLTNKMAHTLRQVPSYMNVGCALRYAQAVGFGADEQAANAIAYSRLSMFRVGEEPFWTSVVQFLARQEGLHRIEVDHLMDYLAHRYRENGKFSMKGRTLSALMNQSQEWHRRVFVKENGEVLNWNSSGIQPLYVEEMKEDQKVVYRTVELLNSVALYDEGFDMQHCVAEYDEDCRDGRSTIFSLQREVEGEPIKRMATLEVELPSRELIQAQAKFNQDLDAKAKELVNLWMSKSEVKPRPRHQPRPQQAEPAAALQVARDRERDEAWGHEGAVIAKVLFWVLYVVLKYLMSS